MKGKNYHAMLFKYAENPSIPGRREECLELLRKVVDSHKTDSFLTGSSLLPNYECFLQDAIMLIEEIVVLAPVHNLLGKKDRERINYVYEEIRWLPELRGKEF